MPKYETTIRIVQEAETMEAADFRIADALDDFTPEEFPGWTTVEYVPLDADDGGNPYSEETLTRLIREDVEARNDPKPSGEDRVG